MFIVCLFFRSNVWLSSVPGLSHFLYHLCRYRNNFKEIWLLQQVSIQTATFAFALVSDTIRIAPFSCLAAISIQLTDELLPIHWLFVVIRVASSTHLNIGVSPILQFSEEPTLRCFILNYYKTFKVEITVLALLSQRLYIVSLLHDWMLKRNQIVSWNLIWLTEFKRTNSFRS